MFGYVRPALNNLLPEIKADYKSVYCGLCHTMGKRHGFAARFTLNYDFTLLALMHYSTDICAAGTTECRCPVHPFRKAERCLCGAALDRAADQSVILTWYKLCDDVMDHGFVRGLPARFLRTLLRRGYRLASGAQPEFDTAVRVNLDRLHLMEAERSPNLDRVADTFAAILSAAACGERSSSERRAMEHLLYHLGRWVYLVDAWDDLETDIRKKRYNPLDARFCGKAADEREYLETTMTHSAHLVQAAANLINFGQWQPIIENVLFIGLPTVQRAVLGGYWKEFKKQGRTTHERSV